MCSSFSSHFDVTVFYRSISDRLYPPNVEMLSVGIDIYIKFKLFLKVEIVNN